MDLFGIKVSHDIFGEGIITEVNGANIIVNFDKKKAKFIFPDAFEAFLTAEDTSVQATILEEISTAKAIRQKVHNQEIERHATSKRVAIATQNIEKGFGSDYNVQHLARQPILTY